MSLKILDLIKCGESASLEFKSTLRMNLRTGNSDKVIEHSVMKTLAAFLNSDGGTLLIGIDDNKNILGLETDFNSFHKADNLDEFQKHFDNLISNTLGNRFQRYLKVDFIFIEEKQICSVTIKEKSKKPVYISNISGQETFYIRRQASTIDLKTSEAIEYIQEHWEKNRILKDDDTNYNSPDIFESEEKFTKQLREFLSDKDSIYYKEIKEHWNNYTLINEATFLANLTQDLLPKSIDYGLLPTISDWVRRHLYYDKEAKYVYNQPHIHMHKSEDEGFEMPAYYHIRFIGILYATAIQNKVDIDLVSVHATSMRSIFSGMIEAMIKNSDYVASENEKEYPTNYHWLISEIFSMSYNWLDMFNDNFVESSSYVDFIPTNINYCLSELYNGFSINKISLKFIVSRCYYSAIIHYFSPNLIDLLREPIEEQILINIPNEFIKPILKFSLNEKYAIRFDEFCKGDYRLIDQKERDILNRLRIFLISNNKLPG